MSNNQVLLLLDIFSNIFFIEIINYHICIANIVSTIMLCPTYLWSVTTPSLLGSFQAIAKSTIRYSRCWVRLHYSASWRLWLNIWRVCSIYRVLWWRNRWGCWYSHWLFLYYRWLWYLFQLVLPWCRRGCWRRRPWSSWLPPRWIISEYEWRYIAFVHISYKIK